MESNVIDLHRKGWDEHRAESVGLFFVFVFVSTKRDGWEGTRLLLATSTTVAKYP